MASDEALPQKPTPETAGGVAFEYGVEHVAFLADGRLVTAGGALTTWDLDAGVPTHAYGVPLRRGAFWALQAAPCGSVVAVVHGADLAVLLVDVDTGAILQTLPHADRTHAIAWSPDGAWVATAGGKLYGEAPDTRVRVWDVAAGTIRWELKGLRRPVVSLDFSADGTRLAAVAGWVGRVWSLVVDGKVRKRPPAPAKLPGKDPMGQCCLIPDTNEVLVALGCTVMRHDYVQSHTRWIRAWSCIQTHACNAVVHTRHGVLANVVDELVMLDPETGEVRWQVDGPQGVQRLVVSPDGESFVAVGPLVQRVRRRRLSDGREA